jgi:ribose 5-phosphate isomerase B
VNVALGSDDAGATLRQAIRAHLEARGVALVDYGVDDAAEAYPSVAFRVGELVAAGTHDTGIGMAIAANKIPGVYAANCHDVYAAERARKSNNAQVLTLGERVIGVQAALVVVDAWLASDFEGGASAAKVAEIATREGRA